MIECNQNAQQNQSIHTTSIVDKQVDSLSIDESKSEFQFDEPCQVNDIKKLDFLEWTSGVTNKKWITSSCKFDSYGFYGTYDLFNKDERFSRVGFLTIHSTGSPKSWRFDDETDELIELTLVSGDIPLWDSISVGMNRIDLLNLIKNQEHLIKSDSIYSKLGHYDSYFEIRDDTISAIRIIKKCDKKPLTKAL